MGELSPYPSWRLTWELDPALFGFLLPAGTLAAGFSSAVAIRNNGARSLALSQASVNVPRAEVRIQETQPGRLFSLMAIFPAGMKLQPDQQVELSVKSNNASVPLIKVPVVYQAKPAAIPPAAPKPSASKTASPGSAGN